MDILDVPATEPQKRFTPKRIIGLTLLILLASVFFFSGYSKLHSNNAFDNFQWTFIDLGFNSQLVAGILARLMIGLEFVLGLFLILHIFLQKFTYKAVIGTLVFFIVYLIFVIIKHGNAGDCGCFGDKLSMSPLNAIIKNVVMIAVTILLMRIYPAKPYKFQDIFIPPITMLGLCIPFIVNVIDMSNAPTPYKKELDITPLYKFTPAPSVDLLHGKHIIVYVSYYCPHCKKAAYLLQIIHRKHPDYPIYMIMAGAPEQEKQFFDESHAIDIPHFYYPHYEEFTKMAGAGTPAIYWINNGKAEFESNYYQLDPKYMEQWLHNGK